MNQDEDLTGQVVAHLGNDVVTAEELHNELRLANIPIERQSDAAVVKPVLSGLVLRKYLVQQARTTKLDRDPSTLFSAQRAYDQLLANAFITRKLAYKSISDLDINEYIETNPLRFKGRVVLTVEQITFTLGALSQSVIDGNTSPQSLEYIDQVLTSLRIPHNRSVGVLAEGEMPDDWREKLRSSKPDSIILLHNGSSGAYLKVLGREAQPLEGEGAISLARQLMNAEAFRKELGIVSIEATREAKFEGKYATLMRGTDRSSVEETKDRTK